jgi:acyl-CoA synthetase (NDP forming)
VETLGDIALRPAPFCHREAYAMIGEIRGHALLQGARGRPRADIDALADTLVAVSELAWHNRDRLESLDINPFVVLPEKQGALALDALIVPRLAAAASAT